MLIIDAPQTREHERRYILSVVLEDMLGLPHRVSFGDRADWRIRCEGLEGEVVLPDALLGCADQDWLSQRTLPSLPLPTLPDGTPALYGVRAEGGVQLDILGSIFFMLTRYEERAVDVADRFGRFVPEQAICVRAGLIGRALVDEYVDRLWSMLGERWPRLVRRERKFAISLTHDVDWVTTVAQPLRPLLRLIAGDGLRRRDVRLMAARCRAAARAYRGLPDVRDPADTFDFLMETSEQHGLTSSFYFLANGQGREPFHHEGYVLSEPRITGLMARIGARGHELGLHGGYGTHSDSASLAEQLTMIRRAADSVGVEQEAWGGRQHFLQFEASTTWAAWEAAGLAYDSSLAFAGAPGFRCGTTQDFAVFDLEARRRLGLVERSLTAMEGSFLDTQYLGLSRDEAGSRIVELARVCRRHGGRFTLLWHNTALVKKAERELYRDVVRSLVAL
jgi:peptidoglycan/xylan/chitin deacetylase (PgdA/CDA1 family)